MTVPFNSVPSALRIPFVTAEFDSSRAEQGPAQLAYRVLLVGQKITAGTATANTLVRVTSADQVATYAGRGSQLHRMAIQYFRANKVTETWIGVLADNGAGVAPTGNILFAGTATAAGTVSLYIGGQLIETAVAVGDTAANVATAVVAEFGDDQGDDLILTAAVDGTTPAKVNLTHRHKGIAGNEVDVRLNYQDGDALPAGITATVTALSGGTTAPTLTSLIAAMGETQFHVIAHPYTDATSLSALEAELLDRAGPMRMIEGLAITAKSDSHSNLVTLGDGRNSRYSSILGGYKYPTPPAEIAASAAGVVALAAAADPARPFQTLELPGVLPPADADQFTNEERNLLLYDGVATTKAAAGGVVQLDRLITTYQTNAAGSPDTAYLDATTIFTLLYFRYSWKARVQSKYARAKLADDGTRVGPGQPVVTPKSMKAEAMHWFDDMAELGLVEGADQFKRDLVVMRNATDPNRLDVLLPPDLINQLVVVAANIQFRL
jgi:phage tail sheath gpL-like